MDKLINIVELAFFFVLTIATAAAFILFAIAFCSPFVAVIVAVFAVIGAALALFDKLD